MAIRRQGALLLLKAALDCGTCRLLRTDADIGEAGNAPPPAHREKKKTSEGQLAARSAPSRGYLAAEGGGFVIARSFRMACGLAVAMVALGLAGQLGAGPRGQRLSGAPHQGRLADHDAQLPRRLDRTPSEGGRDRVQDRAPSRQVRQADRRQGPQPRSSTSRSPPTRWSGSRPTSTCASPSTATTGSKSATSGPRRPSPRRACRKRDRCRPKRRPTTRARISRCRR